MTTSSGAIQLGSFSELLIDRSGFQRVFARMLLLEAGIRGRVLDIGCGPDLPNALRAIAGVPAQHDGLDPSPAVHEHSLLAQRWQSTLEASDVPDAAYDLAFAYNVVEHVTAARPFFARVARLLKPGGVFLALTPNAWHPFSCCVRVIERLGLKRVMHRRDPGVNDYPAYYRLNSPRAVTRAIDGLGFVSAQFQYLPCFQWDRYFPRALRSLPHLYDRLLGNRFGPAMLLLAYRLEKAR